MQGNPDCRRKKSSSHYMTAGMVPITERSRIMAKKNSISEKQLRNRVGSGRITDMVKLVLLMCTKELSFSEFVLFANAVNDPDVWRDLHMAVIMTREAVMPDLEEKIKVECSNSGCIEDVLREDYYGTFAMLEKECKRRMK